MDNFLPEDVRCPVCNLIVENDSHSFSDHFFAINIDHDTLTITSGFYPNNKINLTATIRTMLIEDNSRYFYARIYFRGNDNLIVDLDSFSDFSMDQKRFLEIFLDKYVYFINKISNNIFYI